MAPHRPLEVALANPFSQLLLVKQTQQEQTLGKIRVHGGGKGDSRHLDLHPVMDDPVLRVDLGWIQTT